MANILFKRGLHSALPTTAVDGAFYLTTDSHRLYAGIGTELVDLNKYIRTFESYSKLTTEWADAQLGDFAYIQTGNILAVFQTVDGVNKWVQINANTDTTIKSFTASGDDATDPGTLTLTIEDSEGAKYTETIQFIGTNGTDVTVAADGTITVQGCKYSLGGELDSGVYTIKLTSSDEAEVPSTEITLTAGSNVSFTENDDGIVISAQDTQLAASGHTFTVNNAGGGQVTIVDTQGNKATALLEDGSLFYKVGTGDYQVSVNNQGTLPVYTTEEIDKMFVGLNPMKYKGTVNSLETLNALENVEIGDTYMASASFDVSSITGDTDAKYCRIGDLFIATGTEDDDGIITSITWTYVPAGDDSQTDTTYSAVVDSAEHTIALVNSDGSAVHKIDLDSDGKITLDSSSSDGKTLKTTIGHAAPGEADEDKQSTGAAVNASYASGNYNFNGVTSVVVDETGHVSDVVTSPVAIPAPTLEGDTVAVESNQATVTTTLKDTNGTTLGSSSFILDASKGDNLNLSASGNTLTIQLEWGTFE